MMTSNRLWLCCSSLIGLLISATACWAQSSIDSILASEHAQRSLQAAPLCSDEVFLRRITLDLAGRIPTLEEIRAFQAEPGRSEAIERLLSSDEFSSSWAETWTGMLVGYGEEFQTGRRSLQSWLERSLRESIGYDKIAYRLISAKGQLALDGETAFLLRHREEPAVRVSRVFLGVRLDCARCHDHPFDRWTQRDFENVSKFFQGMEVREGTNENYELRDRTDSTKGARGEELPKFFTSAVPRTPLWRDEFALMVTSCKPFARTYANRIWYQLMDRGIVATPDDFNSENAPSSPALLDYLTTEARQQKFDVRALIRMICNSQAYQRSSAKNSAADNSTTVAGEALFAVRSIKPLTPEQLVDSMAQSLDIAFTVERRAELIDYCIGSGEDDFTETNLYRESVQGLMMRLIEKVKSPTTSLDELFLRTLGHLPSEQQRRQCANRSLDEVAFALVHCNEFFFNH